MSSRILWRSRIQHIIVHSNLPRQENHGSSGLRFDDQMEHATRRHLSPMHFTALDLRMSFVVKIFLRSHKSAGGSPESSVGVSSWASSEVFSSPFVSSPSSSFASLLGASTFMVSPPPPTRSSSDGFC